MLAVSQSADLTIAALVQFSPIGRVVLVCGLFEQSAVLTSNMSTHRKPPVSTVALWQYVSSVRTCSHSSIVMYASLEGMTKVVCINIELIHG